MSRVLPKLACFPVDAVTTQPPISSESFHALTCKFSDILLPEKPGICVQASPRFTAVDQAQGDSELSLECVGHILCAPKAPSQAISSKICSFCSCNGGRC